MTALPADRGAARNDGGGRTTARSVRRARTVARNLRRIEDGELDGGRLARTAGSDDRKQILSPAGDRSRARSPRGPIVFNDA